MIIETAAQVSAPKPHKKNKKTTIVFLVLCLLIVIAAGVYVGGKKLYEYYLSAPSSETATHPFTVIEGETAAEIGKRLMREGFVRSDVAFRLWVKKENLTLQAGEYVISKNTYLPDLALTLTHGTFDAQITLLEGWRREEVVQYLFEKNTLPDVVCSQCSEDEKERITAIGERFLSQTKEGYVFPDTYTLPKYSSLDELIHFINENFWAKFTPDMQNKATERNMTPDNVLILASIIEREVKTADDRRIVAGILIKRLQNDWPLGADATVQYAKASQVCDVADLKCEWWPKDLTIDDLALDSPYNTRLYGGLPPTAICNPSLTSINAVLDAEESEYWYYLSDSQGITHYAKTLEEHNQNIARYL